MYNKKIKYTEVVLITFVWLVILFTPILFRENIYMPLQVAVMNQMQTFIPLILLFLVNRFILVPRLLFSGKQVIYVVSVLGIIILFTAGSFVYETSFKNITPPGTQPIESQIKPPPYAFPGGVDRFGNLRPDEPRQHRPIPPFANFLILSVLVVGFDTGLRSGLRGLDVENEKVRLEKENVATQLVLLRNQVSPHFFMNTLNNIHSLIDIDKDEAREAIIKLSKMMRYLLYETDTEKTTLLREVEFLGSYINLMRLRFNDKVKIKLSLPSSIPEKTIPPFIFISLIENAFKHGVSYLDESFIDIDLTIGNDRLLLIVRNSKTDKRQIDEFSGIGIENTRKRLELLYGNKYNLDIIDNNDTFTVNLSVPL
jgi:hypothetical protein